MVVVDVADPQVVGSIGEVLAVDLSRTAQDGEHEKHRRTKRRRGLGSALANGQTNAGSGPTPAFARLFQTRADPHRLVQPRSSSTNDPGP